MNNPETERTGPRQEAGPTITSSESSVQPLAYVYVNSDNGLAVVRGADAKAFCWAAEPTTGRRWRTTWYGGGWCVPVSAVEDLRAHAATLGRVITVTNNQPPSRGTSRTTSGEIPGQEALL